jgi:hypothetical protein
MDADVDALDVRGPPRTFGGRHAVRHSTRRSALVDGMADGHPTDSWKVDDRSVHRSAWRTRQAVRPAVRLPIVGQSRRPAVRWPSADADLRVEWLSVGGRLLRTCVRTSGHPDVRTRLTDVFRT